MEPRIIAETGFAVVGAEPMERRHRVEMTPDRIQLLKDTMCQGADDNELELALALVERMQLDPFARQIVFIKRYNGDLKREVMTPQVTIDGARLLAERTRKYGGQVGPWWCGEDGVWRDVWLKKEPPAAARVGVLRTDWTEPLYAVARFEAYAARKKEGGLTMMWAKMPDILIAKCAEMLALRRAFPAELSGVYSDDEMQQASNVDALPAPIKTTPQLSKPSGAAQLPAGDPAAKKADPRKEAMTTLFAEAKRHGLDFDLLNRYVQETPGAALEDMTTAAVVQLTQKLKREEAAMLRDRLTNRPAAEVIDGPDMFPDVEFAAEEKPDPWTR